MANTHLDNIEYKEKKRKKGKKYLELCKEGIDGWGRKDTDTVRVRENKSEVYNEI
jgi:hypothetical protein